MVFMYYLVTNEPLPGVAACIPLKIQSYFFTFWIPILVHDIILLSLVLYLAVNSVRRTKDWDTSRLFRTIVRDNIMYFIT